MGHLKTEEFLRLFFGDGESVNFFAIQEGEEQGRRRIGCPLGSLQLQKTLKELRGYNEIGYNVYFMVNYGGTKKDEITRVNAHFMEMDDIPLAEQWEKIMAFPLPPSVVVYSGGKSYHAYWVIKDANVERFREIQKGLIEYFNSDPVIVNENRIMRLPGFLNCKKGTGRLSEVCYFEPSNVYTQDQLAAVLPEITKKENYNKTKRNQKPTKTKTKTKREHYGSPEYNNFVSMITDQLKEVRYYADDDKTQCLCIMPDHDDKNPSGVFFWQPRRYLCSSCGISLPIDQALVKAGGFQEALRFGMKNELFISADKKDGFINKLGYGWLEYSENVLSNVEKVTDITDDGLLAPVALIGKGLDAKSREIAEASTKVTVETLISRNGSISDSHAKDIGRISRLFAYPGQYGKTVVISGQPGIAKTTLLKAYCKKSIEKDPEAGIILVYRTKQDMYENERYLNGLTDIDGHPVPNLEGLSYKRIAFVMQSWSAEASICLNRKMRKYGRWFPGMCSKENCNYRNDCTLTKQYSIQKYYPVVIMTHERLLMDSEDNGKFFETYGTWEDEEGKIHRRRVVIIDEKPDLIRETLIDNYSITRITEMIKEVVEDREILEGEDYQSYVCLTYRIKEAIQAIANQRQNDSQQRVEFSYGDLVPFPERLKSFVRKHVGVEEYKLLVNIEYMFKAGYAYVYTHFGKKEGDDWQIGTSRFMTMDIRDMNVFILDGTADISPDYADKSRYARYDCSEIRSYENWTVKWVKTRISKQKLTSDKSREINEKLARMVKVKMNPTYKKRILVVTLKDNRDKLDSLIHSEPGNSNVVVQYDGNLIGTNDYKDFTCIAFASRIELPPVLYLAKASLINGVHLTDTVAETFQYHRRDYYCNESVEAIKLLSIAENTVQGILRIDRDPNSREKVEVWLFDPNPLLVEVLQSKLQGCKVEVVDLPEFKVKRSNATAYNIAEVAEEMLKERGDGRLPKGKLGEKMGIAKRTLAYSLNREDVINDFAQRGMKITRFSIEWLV